MRRSAQWYVDEAAKQERQLQALVWPKGAPRPTAAQALYPRHPSSRQAETSRRDTAPPQTTRTQAAPSTGAKALYPKLR
jgi:hypothetical protein